MKVVAEGVETPVQLERLRRLKCASVQGFLLSRPLAPRDMDRFLSEHAAS
jgi:EAL domain-containing protein (putative c-di-GMP-specific phosphodiesterase class I)